MVLLTVVLLTVVLFTVVLLTVVLCSVTFFGFETIGVLDIFGAALTEVLASVAEALASVAEALLGGSTFGVFGAVPRAVGVFGVLWGG